MKDLAAVILVCPVVFPAYNKHTARDCKAFVVAFRPAGASHATNEEGRKAEVAGLTAALSQWEDAAKSIQTEQVRKHGAELSTKLSDRKRILERDQFVEPKQEPPSPAASAPSPGAAGSADPADERKKVLAEAAAEGVRGLLGNAEPVAKLPPDVVERLKTNDKEIQALQADLYEWCAANE